MASDDLAALRAEGNEHFQKGDYLKAAAAYTKALKAVKADAAPDPELAPVYSNRSAAFLKLGKARQALSDADACAALRPEWDKAHFRRGAALELLERPAEAVAALEQAASLSGGATKDIAARLKVLRRWTNSGVKPSPPPIAALAAPLAPPPAGAAASGFAFKAPPAVSAGSSGKAAPKAAAASWADVTACERLGATMSAALREPAAALAALSAARAGRGDAAALATALAEACVATGTAEGWQLLGAPLFAVFGKAPARRREAAVALEAFRAKRCPGVAMPLLPDAASLVAAASCAGESAALRRSALEAANAAFLGAARRVGPEGALFEDGEVTALLDAGLPDALLAAVAPAQPPGKASKTGADAPPPPPLREAAAGVFYNLCAHARRLWAASDEADAIYEQLCMLMDRDGNPLEGDASDAAADDWDGASAHSFFAPLAQLLGSPAAPRALLGALSLQKIRTNALAAAQAPGAASAGGAGPLTGVLTILALLERCAKAGAPAALRALADRREVQALQAAVAEQTRRYVAMGQAVAELELRSADAA